MCLRFGSTWRLKSEFSAEQGSGRLFGSHPGFCLGISNGWRLLKVASPFQRGLEAVNCFMSMDAKTRCVYICSTKWDVHGCGMRKILEVFMFT